MWVWSWCSQTRQERVLRDSSGEGRTVPQRPGFGRVQVCSFPLSWKSASWLCLLRHVYHARSCASRGLAQRLDQSADSSQAMPIMHEEHHAGRITSYRPSSFFLATMAGRAMTPLTASTVQKAACSGSRLRTLLERPRIFAKQPVRFSTCNFQSRSTTPRQPSCVRDP